MNPQLAAISVALATALGNFSNSASATLVDLSSGSAGFVNTPGAGAFADIYTFTLTTAATLNGIVSSAVGGTQDVDFSSLTLTGPSGPINMSLVNPDPLEIWTISTGQLAAGAYTLTAAGTNSASMGTYAGSLALSASASAPSVSGAGPLDLSSGSTGFASTPAAGGFTDVYTFTLSAAATLRAILGSAVGGSQDVDFTSVVLTGPSGPINMSLVDPDPFEIWTVSTGVLAPGGYVLTATGTNSEAMGTYVGNIALSIDGSAPPGSVPEPGTHALLLAGLGAAHYTLRRRKVR